MFGREPAIWVAAIFTVIQAILIFATKDVNAMVPEWVVPALTVLAGAVIRQQVVPTKTVKQAGLSPKKIKEDAKNPSIREHEGE